MMQPDCRNDGLADRMDKLSKVKDGTQILWENRLSYFIDVKEWTRKQMVAWGQTYITEDLCAARERDGGAIICEAKNVELHDVESDTPFATYEKEGKKHRIYARYIAGCDG